MKNSKQLKEERADLKKKMAAILTKAETENKDRLSAEERAEWNALKSQIEQLDDDIEVVDYAEKAKAETDARSYRPGPSGEVRELKKMRKEFRFTRLFDALAKGRQPEGIEAEMIQEGEREARNAGITPEGVVIPGFFVGQKPEQRTTLTAGTAATAGNLIATDLGELIEYLYPTTVLTEIGARFLTGLSGNLDLPRKNAAASATWEGEGDANAESNLTTNKIQLRPKRLGAFTIFSKQLLGQASLNVEQLVREDLNMAVGQALEVAAINGSGTPPVPTGILNTSGIGDEAIGTDGGAPTWAAVVGIESDVATANALRGTLAYLTTPGMAGHLKTIKKDAGSGIFLQEGSQMNGYPIFRTTNVPSTLTKGLSSDCHAIIFGNWQELLICQWGGIDLVVNPYSLDTTNEVRVTINSWWDVGVRHAASFAAIKDARIV